MLANDSGITDLLVTERELVMREADGARIVRQFSMLQWTGMKGDRARLFAACVRDAAVQSPQCGKERITDWLPQRVGRTSKRRRSLREVVLKQPCFGERSAKGDFV